MAMVIVLEAMLFVHGIICLSSQRIPFFLRTEISERVVLRVYINNCIQMNISVYDHSPLPRCFTLHVIESVVWMKTSSHKAVGFGHVSPS